MLGLAAGLGQQDTRMLYWAVSCLITLSVWTVLEARDTFKSGNRRRNPGRCDIYVGADPMLRAAASAAVTSDKGRIWKAIRT